MTVLASQIFTGSPAGTDVGLTQVADLTVSANVLGNTTFGIDASAGAVRATLPPATGSGDRIVITADDVTNTAEIASGDSLNGEALGSIFPALNDVVYLVDAKVGDWTGRTLPAPTVTPVDEFNSNAVVTSTVGTLTFAGGDIVITDPNNVETWFAGPSADSSSIGGAASQTAILLDNAYTTLNVTVDAALQGEDVIYWWDNLAAGDTVNGLGLTVSEVIGAGTLTGNGGTADGTGLMGLRISDADGAALILASTVTTTGAIHLFAELPIEVPATGLDLGRKTTAERDALSGMTGGEHLYNTTTETRQWYHPGSSGQTVSYDSTSGPVGGSGINAETTERGQTVPYAAFASQFQTIDLGLSSSTSTSDVQVTVYDGVGLGGTILGQQTITVPVSTPGISQYETVNFPSPVLVPSGAGNFTIGVVRVAGTGGTQFWLTDDYLPGGGNLTLSNALDHSMVLTLTEQGAVPAEWRDYPVSALGEAPGIDTFDASLITHSGAGTYAPNVTNPATGQISVSDGTIERHGTWATYRFRMEFDQDGSFTLDFAGIIPAGSSIVMAYPWGDASAEEPFSDVNFNANGTTAIDFNRADSIDADVNYKVTMVVDGYPEVRSLAPGSLTPTTLASARVMAFSGSGQTALGTVTSTSVDANNAENLFDATARVPLTNAGWTGVNFERPENNGVTVGALEFTIEQAGRYRIDAEVGISGGSSGRAVQIVRNGTDILAISTGYADTGSDAPREAEVYENLVAGDTIDVRIAHQSTSTPGFNNLNILVEQVATDSVVAWEPGQVEATTLSDIQVTLAATTNDSGLSHYGFDTLISSNGGELALSGTGSIQNLQPGKRYKLTANLQLLPPGAGNGEFRFIDLTTSTQIGRSFEVTTPTFAVNASSQTGEAWFTPTQVTEVGIEHVAGSAGEMSNRSTFSVEEQPTLEVVTPGDVVPVDIGHQRFTATADNVGILSGSQSAASFDTYTTAVDSGAIATFDGTNIAVTAGANPVELEALVHTDGSNTHSARLFFRDIVDPIGTKFGDGAVSGGVSSRGFYGLGSANTPATAVVPANTTVTLQVVHDSSANSQAVNAGSYIDVREVVGQQTVIPAGSVTPVAAQLGETILPSGQAFPAPLTAPGAIPGLSVNLPEAGTYEIAALCEAVLIGNPPTGCVAQILLNDTTTGYLRGGTPMSIATLGATGASHTEQSTGTIVTHVTTAGPTTIEVHGLVSDDSGMTTVNLNGGSAILFRRLGDQIITS